MTLRSRLLLAQAPLAAVLVVFGAAAVATITALGRSPELILKDNYRSVLAAERMAQALGRLQQAALAAAAGRPAEPDAAEARRRLEAELTAQEHNITEPGEAEATERLRRSWTAYQAALDGSAAATPAERMGRYFAVLAPAARRLEAATEEILALNQDAMVAKSDRARRRAEQNGTTGVAVTVSALLVGVALSLALTARLLRPLAVLTQTVRRIGEGDLAVRARVSGEDEIAALAGEFNTMADRLEHYRSSSLGELLQAQQASQAAIDSLPDPVLVLDAEGAVLNLNGAAEAGLRLGLGGRTPELAALAPELRAVVDRVRAHVLSGRGAYVPGGFEEAVRVESPDGDRHLLPRATPLYSEQGNVVGVTLVLQDVSRLMRFDELKDDLVATVAHEFRTPLTSLRLAIHLCAEETVGPLTERQADLVFAARQDCERLQGIVDDLLDLSRIQSGRMLLRLERLGVPALLGAAADEVRSTAEAGGVALELDVPEPAGAPLEVAADAERVQLVLGNLLANAVRHTPSGGRVTLAAAEAGGEVRFEVRDTGAGIPREHLEHVFEKFYRVPGTAGGGVGLGLYIAREIVQSHGGRMGVESAPGRGSAFWFTLPRAAGAAGAAA